MKKRMRIPAVFLAAVLFIVGILPAGTAQAAGKFTDVPRGAWYEAAVNDLVDRGVMRGTTSTTFEPRSYLTRAQFTAMLARSVLSEQELALYRYRGRFTDVPAGHWANPYINWAYESKVANGVGGKKFEPESRLSRQDMAKMLVNFARATAASLPPTTPAQDFYDDWQIASYAWESVDICQQAGVITGSGGYFRPRDYTERCEAAQVLSKYLRYSRPEAYTLTHKKISGTTVAALEFDPNRYQAGVAMGNERVKGGEHVTSIVDRTGAVIAVNAAFFGLESYEPYGTIVRDGKLVTTFNNYSPAKSAVVMNSSGRFSLENFTTNITVTTRNENGNDQTAKSVVVNVSPGSPTDGARIIYTRDWGRTLGYKAKFVAQVDDTGYVTAVYRDVDAAIPETGCLLVQRAPRQWGDAFFESIQKDTFLDIQTEYTGSRVQDIELCLAVGPKIVQNGRPYGDSSTYAAEGLLNINSYGNDVRVALGIKPNGNLVLITAVTTLPNLSKIMAELGCESAVNLDGGGSSNLYVNGLYLTGPRDRLLNNVLYFK